MKNVDLTKFLIEALEYFKYQIKSGKCTMDEIESIASFISKELDARGTIKDFAEFYGQSESNVRNVISRRPIPSCQKPRRQVTYGLGWFSSQVPNSWRHNR